MNTNLLNIIKQIVYEKGESILSDPQKLNPLFKDYAKDEPKDERIAFGRCIEIGAYQELKNASPSNIASVKTTLVSNLQNKTGLNYALCSATIALLEAVIYNVPQTNFTTGMQTNYQSNNSINRGKVMKNSMAKTGFFMGLINLLHVIIVSMNRQSINLPEQDRGIIILAWFIITVVLAITGFFVSKKGYDNGSQGLGIAGMAFNGIIILPVIILLFMGILNSFKNQRKNIYIK